jgi:hypothetical protein
MLVQIDGIDDLKDITTLPHQIDFERCRAGQADANMPSPGFSYTQSASVATNQALSAKVIWTKEHMVRC